MRKRASGHDPFYRIAVGGHEDRSQGRSAAQGLVFVINVEQEATTAQ